MLSILSFIGVLFAAYFIYKTAKDTGRNAVGWALLTLAVGIGIQIVLPILIGIIITFVMMLLGNSIAEVQEFVQIVAVIISIICLILSFVGIGLIIRHISKIPEDGSFVSPPPPPAFDGK